MSRVRAAGAAAAVLALCLSGCGGTTPRTLDTRKVEKGIAAGITHDHPGTKVSVTCPRDIAVKKGERFQCRVRGRRSGEDVIATVTQADDQGRVRYRVP